RYGVNLWRLYNGKPLPVLFQDIFPKELQPVSIYFDRTPRMALNELGKIDFKLFQSQLIRTAAKMLTDSTDCPGIGLNCFLAFSLKFQRSQVRLIKLVKSFYFFWMHVVFSFFY
ncbi:MAG: hypothetical protein WA151_20905, partial [Desulfatirhabdiaceae bacterium]